MYPDPVEAALVCASAGADSITVHLREDRRHIQDHDVERVIVRSPVPINLEMAVTRDMTDIACRLKPRYVCLVPEKREEKTTEGGLDAAMIESSLKAVCQRLAEAGIQTALFVDPDPRQLQVAIRLGVPHLEIHTGRYCDASDDHARAEELMLIRNFAAAAHSAGIEVHAGHGLTVDNVGPIAAIPEIVELNIGHSLIARSVFIGLPAAVAEMRRRMSEARG